MSHVVALNGNANNFVEGTSSSSSLRIIRKKRPILPFKKADGFAREMGFVIDFEDLPKKGTRYQFLAGNEIGSFKGACLLMTDTQWPCCLQAQLLAVEICYFVVKVLLTH